MSFEEEFDRIIQRKAEEADFPFDEQNWEKARMMLDNERRAMGIGFSSKMYITVFLFLLAASAGYFVYNGFIDPSPTDLAVSSGKSHAGNKVVEKENVEGQKKSDVKKTTDRNDANALSESDGMKGLQNATPTSENKVKTVTAASNNFPQTTENKIIANNFGVEKNKTELLPRNEGINYNSEIATSHANAVASEFAEESAVNLAGDEKTMGNTTGGPGHNFVEPAASDGNEFKYEPLLVEPMTVMFPLQEFVATPEIISTPINTLDYFDEDYYTQEKHKTHYIDAEAGAAYLLGWQSKNGKDGQGINWFGGVNFGFYVSKKISLSAGIQAYNIAHIDNPFFNNKNTEYGFNSKTTQTLITTNSLYYLAFPLRFSYAINPQNQFGVGCNIGLLMSSKNTEETYFYQSDVRTDKSSVKTTGYYEGMNTTHVMLSVFYKTKLGKRLHLNGEATFAPFNIYKYANSQINTANTLGFRLSLQYTLFEK